MNILRFFHKNQRKGFTLMETLVTVGIVAVLCAIAIPSIITVNRSMNERGLDNSARAVYLAAQSNLAQMRSSGDLEKLAAMTSDQGARNVPETGNANMGGDWNEQLRHTVSGTSEAFNLVLPANVLDSQLREQQILIEYNPFSGHVYAVFYSEGEQELTYSLIGDRTNEEALKEKGIGYYYGGSVTIAPAEVNSTAVTLSADTDGQELIASVTVPVPESYTNHQDKFHEYLSAKLTIRGEMSGAELVIPTDSLSLKKELCIGSPNYIEFTFVLDSLNVSNAFAVLNTELGKVDASTLFFPGENLTIAADVQFDAPEGETILTFDEVVITGVNSLFAEMKQDDEGYHIELSNGRHLQNLNALNSDLAKKVATIELVEDIYWNETVEYYTDAYVTPKAARAAEAVDYEHFVPLNTSAFEPAENDAVATSFDGKGNSILYLNIKNTTFAEDATEKDKYTGLFGLCEIDVKNLSIVSPVIEGTTYTGALAGYANGAVIENCSVYIDTEDEYFSWDKMDTYGVTGKTAGGLVDYATSGTFTNCFAAVNVDAAENAGGFVGHSNGADASMCYASGNVTGKAAGGFVGYSDDAAYQKCFASGNVEGDDIAGGFTGKMECTETSGTYNQCYAVGVVKTTEENGDADGFCGTSNLDETVNENEQPNYDRYKSTENSQGVYSDTYYLSDTISTKESYYADPASYAQLAGEKKNGVTVLGWTKKAVETHSYSLVENGEYPFLVYSENLHYYGEWPEEECPVALAYYEKYKDDNNPETKEIGFYISGESDSTLQHDRTVLEDGYVLLCQEQLNDTLVELEGSDLPEAYKVYDPTDFGEEISGGFYDKVVVDLTIENVPTRFTLYYNPDFALTQLNPVIDEAGKSQYSAKLPTTAGNIPSKIYIRTARHLAAIAADANTEYRGEGYNYIQMIDVDFGSYDWGTDGYTMKSIANFAGSYTGAGGYVSQAKIKLNNAITLFGTITGKVSHVDIVAGDLGTAEAGFVMENAGEIINCTVGPATEDMTTGLTYGFAKQNSGTIRGSMANTGATNAAFVGTNDGTIADCYAWYPGTAADPETKIIFAETDTGEIVSSYAAIYARGEEPAYVLVYDRDSVASFCDTLKGITLGENWYSYSDAIIEKKGYYPYSTLEGISHRGGWSEFAEQPEAFTGYYYYETDANGQITGLYIESVGTTGEVVSNTLSENVPAGTCYGIYTVVPPVEHSAYEVAEVALTLNSAPIVPSDLENGDNREALIQKIKEAFKAKYDAVYNCTMVRELSSQSVYVLNGTEINTWFAPANADGAYRIRTAEQFAAIGEFPGESFIQETDITIEKPLNYFEGTYDGGENILRYDSEKPLTITLDAANGVEVDVLEAEGNATGKKKLVDNVAYGLLVNVTGENAVIKNCRVVGAIDIKESAEKATAEHSVEITAAIGGLVGENHGTIKTSSVEGLKVTHTAATVTKGISYTADITLGGLVGLMADGRLDECFVTGDITMTSDAGDSIGGAVGVVDAVEEASVTCMDSYAAVNISASGATVGAFVGKAENGTFYYCHGWNSVNEFIGANEADTLRLVKCYHVLPESDNSLKVWTYTAQNGTETGYVLYESLSELVVRLNDDRSDIWSTKTTQVDETGKESGNPLDVKYPVLAGRYDANAVGTPNLYKEPEVDSVKLDAPAATEAPVVTAEPETTPETTEQPNVTVEPETTEQPDVTAEPEATEIPAETAVPEVTPEPTAEPTPVPTETPVVEVTPEPTAETEPVSEEA